MTATLIDEHATGFADGNAGHVYDFNGAGAPSVGQTDVLCVNSNTTVSTPSGFTSHEPVVANQGAYIFSRKAAGGEGTTVTITTAGDENTTVSWSRWGNVDAFSVSDSAQANNSNGLALPALATGTLPDTDMLLVAFAALHNHDGALATGPSWSNSFNALTSASQGAAGSSTSCVAFVGYKTNAGTASETINSVTWTNNVRNRYALYAAFTTTSAGQTVAVGQASETNTAQTIVRAKTRVVGQGGETDLARTVTRSKTRTVGQNAETDLAQPVARTKQAAVGQASETDLARTVGWTKAAAVGRASETDLARTITADLIISVGQVGETNTARQVGRTKQATVGRTTETDQARALTSLHTRGVGQTSEADAARVVAAGRAIAVGLATQTETARPVSHVKTVAVGRVVDTSTARAVTAAGGTPLTGSPAAVRAVYIDAPLRFTARPSTRGRWYT